MVALVRQGFSLRRVAHRLGAGFSTVRRWVQRAGDQRLGRVEWSNRSSVPHHPARTEVEVEERVLTLRRVLRETSDLGHYGASAIWGSLRQEGRQPLPSVRTIGRILRRRGALDGRLRVRRPAPPPGWYLPEVAAGRCELDSFDGVEGLVIRGGTAVEVLNGVSLHGGLVVSYPVGALSAKIVAELLVEHWRQWGLPGYAQFDNDTLFQGPHQWADVIGRVSRLCLSLGIVPVFAPPRETGFQARIENYNGSWQAKVWARFQHGSLAELQERSQRYVAALRQHRQAQRDAAPSRRPWPPGWKLDLQAPPRGRLIYLRRTSEQGTVEVLGHTLAVDSQWTHRLVRAEVDLDASEIAFYRLRRREPSLQPLLSRIGYTWPTTHSRE